MPGRTVSKLAPQPPVIRRRRVGTLKVFSGTVLIEDPSFFSGLRLRNVPKGEHTVTADVIHYPEGGVRAAKVSMNFAPTRGRPKDLLGEVGVDSAQVIITDARAQKRVRWRGGPERLGVVVPWLARRLKKHFGLDSRVVDPERAEILQPVSRELEEEITAHLKTFPTYAPMPSLFFWVETGSAEDQIKRGLGPWDPGKLWCELNLGEANAFAFRSGFGDGTYPVRGRFESGALVKAEVEFIGPAQDEILEAFPILRY